MPEEKQTEFRSVQSFQICICTMVIEKNAIDAQNVHLFFVIITTTYGPQSQSIVRIKSRHVVYQRRYLSLMSFCGHGLVGYPTL